MRRRPHRAAGGHGVAGARASRSAPEYGAIGVGRDDGKRQGEHAAILFRRSRLERLESGTFWLSETPEVPGSVSWGSACVRICTWGRFREATSGRELFHFNTHLDHESALARRMGIELILARIAKCDAPVLLTGDFNVGEEDEVVQAVKAARLRDTFREVHPEEREVGTFNGWAEEFGAEKIDYVFAAPGWQVEGAEIVREQIEGRWPSDHAPVTARLRLAPC